LILVVAQAQGWYGPRRTPRLRVSWAKQGPIHCTDHIVVYLNIQCSGLAYTPSLTKFLLLWVRIKFRVLRCVLHGFFKPVQVRLDLGSSNEDGYIEESTLADEVTL
jgi:hypothetical protein